MSSFAQENIKVLHLELTSRCNASCPQCARNDVTTNYTTDYDLSLERVKELFSEDFVRKLGKVFACGVFGDPAAAKECIPIFQWFKEVNPNIVIGMHTNGGVRNPAFWASVAKVMNNPYDYVVFSIDGLEDTNHIYRVNVQWKKVMENAQAYISAGGSAHWDALIYQYNEHQVDDMRALAKSMGFTWFRTKVTSRFDWRPVEFLKPPKNFQIVKADGPVYCRAIAEKSLYVAATGKLMPCCHLGDEIFRLEEPLKSWLDEKDFVSLDNSLKTKPFHLCQQYCGTANSQHRTETQFRENTQLC